MSKASSANPFIKLNYLNGHHGYFLKFGMLSNGFGLPLHLTSFDDLNVKIDDSNLSNGKGHKQTSDNASLKPILNVL
ncbi:MAG: hypothetical protein FH753_12365 [Firmicutes bacterium]|nr:hypothetical protein [Bacillota bacterium]